MDPIQIIGTKTQELLTKLHVTAELEVSKLEKDNPEDRDTYHILVNGDDLGLLIGYKGENLDALEMILAQMVNKELETRIRLVLDIGNWKKERYASIERMIDQALLKIDESQLEYVLPSMKAHERRKAHDYVSKKGFSSESVGYEPNRRVVIKPKANE